MSGTMCLRILEMFHTNARKTKTRAYAPALAERLARLSSADLLLKELHPVTAGLVLFLVDPKKVPGENLKTIRKIYGKDPEFAAYNTEDILNAYFLALEPSERSAEFLRRIAEEYPSGRKLKTVAENKALDAALTKLFLDYGEEETHIAFRNKILAEPAGRYGSLVDAAEALRSPEEPTV